ncbi:hypothetical protein NS274_08790 [Pseudomonas oryzihabitans]|nr:hypothetical protein NS274_08790 [Pseudomonas psychrotolerans]KTS96807.1 hypothetical protein NS376_18680 [Pseudomonas psychrotolerans]KTT53543.1 hypothetical protein SB8_20080 [Pseudomonas psychrotolerans]KTT62982.1 hypothetical protein NS383_21780 [Pseudomonas psychrotolerans]
MVLSLSEASINNQLRVGWKVWKRIKIGNPDKISVDGVDLLLGHPTISLDTKGLPDNRVRMSLTIESSKLPNGKDVAQFLGWKVHFFSQLQKRILTPRELFEYDATAAGQVDRWEQEENTGPGAFSIEALLMTLAQGDCTLEPPAEVTSFDMPDEALRKNLITRLETWLGSDSAPLRDKLLLNCVVYPAVPDRDSTFSLRDYALKITNDESRSASTPLTRTLDYLGVFHGPESCSMPSGTDLDAARARLGPWYEIENGNGLNANVAGLMVLRGALFREHMRGELLTAFAEEAKRLAATAKPNRTVEEQLDNPQLDLFDGLSVRLQDRTLSLSNRKTFRFMHDDIDYALNEVFDMTITSQPGNTWSVKGGAAVRFDRKRKEALFESEAFAFVIVHLEGSLTFRIENKGLEYSVKPLLHITARIEEAKGDGKSDWFRKYVLQIANDYDVRRAKEVATRFAQRITEQLLASFDKVQVTLDNMAFVPPGEKTFAYPNLRFNEQHDLMFDVIYADVTIPRQSLAQGKGTSNAKGH